MFKVYGEVLVFLVFVCVFDGKVIFDVVLFEKII